MSLYITHLALAVTLADLWGVDDCCTPDWYNWEEQHWYSQITLFQTISIQSFIRKKAGDMSGYQALALLQLCLDQALRRTGRSKSPDGHNTFAPLVMYWWVKFAFLVVVMDSKFCKVLVPKQKFVLVFMKRSGHLYDSQMPWFTATLWKLEFEEKFTLSIMN